jgi:SpoIVB peptidase S55
MKKWLAIALVAAGVSTHAAEMARPKAGKVEIFHLKDIKPGMQATAWTVFQGSEPESVPIEIIGVWNKANGPNDVILGKMGGKAKETNVAAGMSGSPVYIDGKLIGAVALRISVFSPDSICGITPIESMLEINDFDASRPADARTPGSAAPPKTVASTEMPNELLARLVAAGVNVSALPQHAPLLTPIETPLVFSGFSEKTLRTFDPLFSQMGITPVQGGGGAAGNLSAKPVAGWEKSLNPGDSVAGILVSGDLSITGTGTVTYNDGKRILAFGHPFMSLGPVEMPMAKSDVVMTLASSYQPTKLPNTTDVVGALHQDRFSGIMGELGDEAPTVPVHFKVRTFDAANAVVKEKDMNFSIFVHQKWTPYLMLLTLATSLQQINEYADEITYRMTGNVQMADGASIHSSTMLAGNEAPAAPPLVLASWWADKFNKLFLNPIAMPKLKSVDCTIDLLPDRRVAAIDNAWTPNAEVTAGSEIPVKVFLRPYRGERMETTVNVKIPEGMPKGEHRILFSDADTLNRLQTTAVSGDRYLDIPETVSLLNQERSNNRMYVSFVEGRATYYSDDKTLPSLPASMLNVLQTERTPSRSLAGTLETVQEQSSVSFDEMVSGSYLLRIAVK